MESTNNISNGAILNEKGVLLQYDGGPTDKYATPEGTTFIAANAFKGMHIEHLIIRGARKIGQYACAGAHIRKITISSSVVKIGEHAFANMPELSEVSFEENSQLEQIGAFCFSNDISLKKFESPNSVYVIDNYAFAQSGLESITLSKNLKILGEGALMDCTNLKSIVLPDDIKDIKARLCSGCTSLTSVTFPKNLTTISKCSFYNCKSLQDTIDLSDKHNLCLVESNSFAYCDSLEEVKLPRHLQEGFAYLQAYSFYECPSLKMVTLPKDGVKKAQKAFSKCPLIKIEIFSDEDAEIPEFCFEDLLEQKELMPESVQYAMASTCTDISAEEKQQDSSFFVRLVGHLDAIRKAVFQRNKNHKESPVSVPNPNYRMNAETIIPTFDI